MKKYLLLLLFVVTLCGCKLDEAGFPKESEVSILGKWYTKKVTTYMPAQHNDPSSLIIDTDFNSTDFLLFTSKELTVSEHSFNSTDLYKYTLSGSTLSLTSDYITGTIDPRTIAKLTTDSLVLVINGSAMLGFVSNTFVITERYARK